MSSPSQNEIALQLLPEHRLFAQAFVATRGDRGKSILATNRPCPSRAILSRSNSILSRQDVKMYIYSMLISDAEALRDFRADPEWCVYIEGVLELCGSGLCASFSAPSAPASGGLISAAAAQGTPDVSFLEDCPVGDPLAVQQFFMKIMQHEFLPMQHRLKAAELYARSLGMFDPSKNSSPVPVFDVTPLSPPDSPPDVPDSVPDSAPSEPEG